MKRLAYTLLVIPLIFWGCREDPEAPKADGIYDVYITGITESLTYEFSPHSGRLETTPEDVHNLSLFIISEDGSVVYERRYFNYDIGYPHPETQELPDTIYIPDLAAGTYTIVAVTADFYYDPHHERDLLVYPYVTSPGPIFASYEVVELVEEDQVVEMDMKNISSRVRVRLQEGQQLEEHEYVGFSFETSGAQAFNIKTGEFEHFDEGYNNIFYTNLGPVYYWQEDSGEVVSMISENDIYILPQDLLKVRVEYWGGWSTSFVQEIDIEPDIQLKTGDAITFTVDIEALIAEGTNPGIFNWEEIEWNELEEVTIP